MTGGSTTPTKSRSTERRQDISTIEELVEEDSTSESQSTRPRTLSLNHMSS